MNANNFTNPPPTPTNKPLRTFRIYRKAHKEMWNDRELQIAKKRCIKTYTSIQCKESHWTLANMYFKDEIQLSKQKSLIKIFKHNKSLLSLKFPIQTSKTFHINIILPHLKNLRALSKLSLELTDLRWTTSKICRSFALSVKNLKQLTSLDHNLYQNLLNPSKSLKTFRHFPLIRNLSNLSLLFNSTKTFTDQSFYPFSYHLSRLHSLTSLSLNLSNCEGLKKISLSHLFSSIGKLSLLTTFALYSYGSKILDSSVLEKLFQHLGKLSSLQELALAFSGSAIHRASSQETLATGLGLINPSSLRKISLGFYSNFLDSDLSELLIVIRRFSSLTHLQLGFNQVSPGVGQGLSNLHETLKHFPLLTHFSFIDNRHIDVTLALNSLSLCLVNLKHLQSLKISAYDNESLNNLVIQDFSTKLYQLSGLQHLSLNFSACKKLSDRGLESIAFALRGLENLESLYLRFDMLDEISNQGAKALGSSLTQLKSLKTLQFQLGYCRNVGGEGLGPLTASLKRLNCLNEIYLNFGHFRDKSGSENYEDLVTVVSRSDTLRKIYLGIPEFRESKYCDEIAEKASKSSEDFRIRWF